MALDLYGVMPYISVSVRVQVVQYYILTMNSHTERYVYNKIGHEYVRSNWDLYEYCKVEVESSLCSRYTTPPPL